MGGLAGAVDRSQVQCSDDAVATEVDLERILRERLGAGHRGVGSCVKGLRVGTASDETGFGVVQTPWCGGNPAECDGGGRDHPVFDLQTDGDGYKCECVAMAVADLQISGVVGEDRWR